MVVVQKGHGGRGTSGRANVYKLPDFSAALDHMGKRRPTRPALAAPTAADYERAKQSASAHGGAHSKGCAAMRTESAPAPKQSALNHGGAPSSAENQAALNQASRVGTGLRERSKINDARTRQRAPSASRENGAREPDSLSELDPNGRQRGGEPRVPWRPTGRPTSTGRPWKWRRRRPAQLSGPRCRECGAPVAPADAARGCERCRACCPLAGEIDATEWPFLSKPTARIGAGAQLPCYVPGAVSIRQQSPHELRDIQAGGLRPHP